MTKDIEKTTQIWPAAHGFNGGVARHYTQSAANVLDVAEVNRKPAVTVEQSGTVRTLDIAA